MRTSGIARRSIAASSDGLVALVFVGIAFMVGILDPVVFHIEPGWFWTEWWLKHWLDSPEVFVRPALAWAGLGVAWTVAWELASGRTPGDRLAGIEIVDADGDPPHPGRTALRALGLVINVVTLGLGWLLCFVAPSRRALHDVLSGTFVVRSRD